MQNVHLAAARGGGGRDVIAGVSIQDAALTTRRGEFHALAGSVAGAASGCSGDDSSSLRSDTTSGGGSGNTGGSGCCVPPPN